MTLLRRLTRLTARYWTRRYNVIPEAASDLADLALWNFHATDEQIMDQRAYELADASDPEPW